MIEFFGELSDNCKIETAKRNAKNAGFIFLIATIFFGIIPTIVFGIQKHSEFYYFLGGTILLALLNVYIFRPPNVKRILMFRIPIRIIINSDSIVRIAYQVQEITKTKSITKIKKIIDAGEWYYLIFRFGDITNSWVCQKNLMVKGSINEFEKLFEGKIIKPLNK